MKEASDLRTGTPPPSEVRGVFIAFIYVPICLGLLLLWIGPFNDGVTRLAFDAETQGCLFARGFAAVHPAFGNLLPDEVSSRVLMPVATGLWGCGSFESPSTDRADGDSDEPMTLKTPRLLHTLSRSLARLAASDASPKTVILWGDRPWRSRCTRSGGGAFDGRGFVLSGVDRLSAAHLEELLGPALERGIPVRLIADFPCAGELLSIAPTRDNACMLTSTGVAEEIRLHDRFAASAFVADGPATQYSRLRPFLYAALSPGSLAAELPGICGSDKACREAAARLPDRADLWSAFLRAIVAVPYLETRANRNRPELSSLEMAVLFPEQRPQPPAGAVAYDSFERARPIAAERVSQLSALIALRLKPDAHQRLLEVRHISEAIRAELEGPARPASALIVARRMLCESI